MSQPVKYKRTSDFTKNHGSTQNDSLLNAELDNVATTVNGLRTRQAIILKDDDSVANGIIGLDNLTDALKNSLDTTVTDSALALETASEAKEEADQAITDSATAVTTANQASAKADTAVSTANDANTKATNAVSTADSASATANTAKETAESVVDQYNTAISTANSAVTTAGNAANTANEALSTANAASTTATEAKTIATNAQTISTQYSSEIINYETAINATVATIPTQITAGIEAYDIPSIVEEEVEKQVIAKQDITAEKIATALGYTPADEADLTAEATSRESADTTLQSNITAEAKARADADTALQENIDNIGDNLATVATSGSYNDLTNKPSLATVATSGKYSDLTGTPSLATVATSGSYNDLSNKPTIPTVPTNISAFTNDTGYALESDLNEEASARSTADSTLQSNIDAVSTVANTALANTLPPQTGNANKFLTTDGTSASWGSVPTRNLGEIIESAVPLTDAGLHLMDGSLLASGGIYDAFITYMSGLQSSYPDLFCTETEWQTSVSTYGSCGKFVYSSSGLRLPKVSDILQGTTDTSAVGDLVEAGLPNITGYFQLSTGTEAGKFYALSPNTAEGVFAKTSNTTYASNFEPSSSSTAPWGVTFNASRSSSIYGNSTTVQPQTIRVLLYICVATSTKTDIEVDIDEIATDLNGKAGVDLANLNSSGKAVCANMAMPSTKQVSLTYSGGAGTEYTAPADGWFAIGIICSNDNGFVGIYDQSTNLATMARNFSANNDTRTFMQVPKGRTIKVFSGAWSSTSYFAFIYANGAE